MQTLLPDQPYEINQEGETYIAHVEAQTRFEADIPARMTDYGVYLWSRYRLPVYSYVLVLVPRGMPDDAPTSWTIRAGGLRLTVDYTVVRLWEVEAADALAVNSESLLPFVPLMRGSREELERGARALGAVADEARRRELALHFLVLGGLRYNRDEIFDLLGRITMVPLEQLRESSVYQFILEEGLEKGREEGREEGRTEATVSLLRRLAAKRFPGLELGPELDRVRDLDALEQLCVDLDRFADAEALQQRIAALSALTP
jgi:predicted transposase YdaD